jgi:threonine/homoserine/homoserine lactone efflux protein
LQFSGVPDLHSLWLFIVAGLLLNLTPGPDVLYIVGRSLNQGRTAGIVSVLGIGVGCLFHIVCAACGLSALVLALPVAYQVIRYAGAVYLIFLGLRTLCSRSGPLKVAAVGAVPLRTVFRQGMLTNMLNPKVAIFFLAFLPQFASPANGPLAPQILLLGFIFAFNGTLVCLAYALAAARLGDWLKSHFGLANGLNRATGALFLALGLRLAFLDRK